MSLPVYLRQMQDGSFVLQVWVQPKASHTEWAGMHAGRLKVRVAAPPIDGKANRGLIRFLCNELALSEKCIQLERGKIAREKSVRIKGISQKDLLARLPCGGVG